MEWSQGQEFSSDHAEMQMKNQNRDTEWPDMSLGCKGDRWIEIENWELPAL